MKLSQVPDHNLTDPKERLKFSKKKLLRKSKTAEKNLYIDGLYLRSVSVTGKYNKRDQLNILQ